MVTYKPRLALSDLLLQPQVVEHLRERFSHIQNSLTTTIHEASGLTNLSEAQLRYAETRGLLAPSRAVSDIGADSPSRGQRRYTVENLLRAHLIAFILEQGYSLSEISVFIENNVSIIHDLLETTSLRLRPVLNAADTLLFKRFFVPRALYSALSLIFERDAIADAGIILPVRATNDELQLITPGEVETADDLIHLGHILVAWRARGRPLATFITAGNPFEREQQIRLTPLSQHGFEACERSSGSLALPSAASSYSFSPPIHAYIAYTAQSEAELFQADHQLALRLEGNRRSRPGARRLPNPRAVATRLISYVQTWSCGDVAAIGQTETALSDAQFFNAPEMVNAALGDALLNRLADTIVELGGMAPPQPLDARSSASRADGTPGTDRLDEEHQEQTKATRWRFACVLTPRTPDASPRHQELVVRAQSARGPHRIGVTTTSSILNGGLTFRAYSSGHVEHRSVVDSLDPAISYMSEESPIGSALAAPAMDGHGAGSQPSAVIYIASGKPDAFDVDDFLLIRMMGRLVSEIVQTYNSRGQQPNALTNMLDDPEIVDSFFAEFLSEQSFMTDLQAVLSGLQSGAPAHPQQPPSEFARSGASLASLTSLTLIGLDVNDYSGIERRQGDRVARLLIREIGRRLQQRMTDGLTRGVSTTQLYRAWGDRFYLLVRDEERDKARQRAERIRLDISIEYRLKDSSLPIMSGGGGPDTGPTPWGIPVGVRMAGMTLTQGELRAQLQRAGGNDLACAASLAHLLEDGLKRANEASNKGACSVWWDAELNDYEPIAPRAEAQSRLA